MVFSVDLGTYNVNKMTQSSLQPTVDFSDVDSDTLAQAVIHTSGFKRRRAQRSAERRLQRHCQSGGR